MALALHEDEASYKYLYKTVKETLHKYFKFDFQPMFSMSDSHKGQLKAIQAVFPNLTRLRNSFHLLQNINRLILTYVVEELLSIGTDLLFYTIT